MPTDDWRPTASLSTLRRRAVLLDSVRRFFRARGYWEVETPLLSHETCVDAWLEPVAVPHPSRPAEVLYLQTSPEFAMKRLLAAGADAIFQITKSFRKGEAGARHNLEFTILEWYRCSETHFEQMSLVEDLVRSVARCDCTIHPPLPHNQHHRESGGPNREGNRGEGVARSDATSPNWLPDAPFPRFTYDVAARAALGVPVLELPTAQLRELALDAGVSPPASLGLDDRDGWLNLLLAERIEPWLARLPACFLYDYPSSQAALARIRPGTPPVAERFELYLGGLELCNGYHELLDADELAERNRRHNDVRIANGCAPLPVESRLLDAMRHGLPACSGVALGFDRLVMWRLGLSELKDVLAFPFDLA